jgi:DNA polymerase-3 subunit alpha
MDLFDFAQRIDPKRVNKGVLESLVQSGAYDATLSPKGITRARAFAALDQALERSRSATKDRERGQTSLFGLFAQAGPVAEQTLDEYPQCEPWDLRDMLVREKQSLGFYVSGHPLDRYGAELGRFDVVPTGALAAKDSWAKVRVAGMVEGYREKIIKGGGKLAFFHLEDTSGRVEVKVRDKQIEAYGEILRGTEPVLVSGKVSFPQVEEGEEESGPRDPTLMLDEVVILADAIRSETKNVRIRLNARKVTRDHIGRLKGVLQSSPGGCPVQLLIQLDDGAEAVLALGRDLQVSPSDMMLANLEKLFGEKVAELR